ncbi:hypothetical protein HUA74_23455 [Myxococcus sp. CA051A]|uniref:hypothetical protein n=1 Tax=unclassified Myxococcus TaxID=2648731 RepID=UPI00157B8D1C|nr:MULTISPECIES: hypothetical protein [unclassified Myxococcus]NTX17103.1 hypothetical protein [Myxococcus sp. CA056]NTX35890.1 hypothetical protein [Myxococcus sp. CA033]NTX63617.1 hypothetical protein [Myxococcus sp. CA051A]
MRKSIMGGLLAVGMLAGCGGVDNVGEDSQLGTRADELPFCEGFSFVTYYSDATYSVQVGHGDCSCGHTLRVVGQKTDFAVYLPENC